MRAEDFAGRWDLIESGTVGPSSKRPLSIPPGLRGTRKPSLPTVFGRPHRDTLAAWTREGGVDLIRCEHEPFNLPRARTGTFSSAQRSWTLTRETERHAGRLAKLSKKIGRASCRER